MIRKRSDFDEMEWAHILENAGEFSDPLDEQKRTIEFGEKSGVPLSNYEEYEIEKEDLKEKLDDAVKYLELINSTLNNKKIKLDKISNNIKEFDKQINSLQIYKPETRDKLNEIKYKDIKPSHVKKILKFLEEDREAVKKKMEYFASRLGKAQVELLKKDKQISDVKSELALMEKKEKKQIKKKTLRNNNL